MTSRLKRAVTPLIETEQEFTALIGELSRDILVERAIKTDMDTELTRVRERYEADLGRIAETNQAKLKLAQDWCDTHPDSFPKGRRSLEPVHAVVGYRLGTPKVRLLRGWKLAAVVAAVKRRLPEYLRVKEELDKERILSEHKPGERIESIGVEVMQEESFFVEPKLEELESRLTA